MRNEIKALRHSNVDTFLGWGHAKANREHFLQVCGFGGSGPAVLEVSGRAVNCPPHLWRHTCPPAHTQALSTHGFVVSKHLTCLFDYWLTMKLTDQRLQWPYTAKKIDFTELVLKVNLTAVLRNSNYKFNFKYGCCYFCYRFLKIYFVSLSHSRNLSNYINRWIYQL